MKNDLTCGVVRDLLPSLLLKGIRLFFPDIFVLCLLALHHA